MMKGRRRGRQGKPDGNVSGQRLQSKIELERGDDSSLKWATGVIIKDHSSKGLVVPCKRSMSNGMVRISAMNLASCFPQRPDSSR